MRRNVWISFGIIVIITIISLLIDWPKGPALSIGSFYREFSIHQGLDLKGGAHLVFELDTSKVEQKQTSSATQSVINVIDRRVNGLGVTEPLIQSAKIGNKESIIVELPGISDVNEAINLIGKTAQLKFKEPDASGQDFVDTELTGANLRNAEVQFDQNTGDPQVSIQFNSDGTKLFAALTQKNIQKPIAIELDGEIISAPTVQTPIENGQAVITGKFSIDEAKKLAIELNAGALPVPIKLVEQRNIGPTLGSESVKKSLTAGLVGLILIALFMIIYYRVPGLIAIFALIIYSLITIALFKVIPVTLTLTGIAGFILSIGMAVDANILIFERMKEELLAGKTTGLAIEEGFRRAWPSIRDSNFSSLITCLILYYGTSGLVRGFAVTLALGIIVSMFSAIFVTRTFLRLAIGTGIEKYLIVK
ncbi:MAG: Preprotein translocase subunit SecD [Berkelbacteria bacterium GW2011_GWB1_38_5]|uniref:Protein translocase subunit SecD n=2 Tax=Candidatus Berkelbacteria TaxID=1618330 RepID=A0A0G0LHK1_9BACT|nr:MAG: Preprotein translocase subunit SecD [Berkelbacteria bacterium GW2011_GWB1_38_5]KKQ90542.1 MAG: Preprotein translocase subunit SecD [Berkelbacteria bacterium GW2011_GWA1_39_10]